MCFLLERRCSGFNGQRNGPAHDDDGTIMKSFGWCVPSRGGGGGSSSGCTSSSLDKELSKQDAVKQSEELKRVSAKLQTALRRRRRADVVRAMESDALRYIPMAAPSKLSGEQALQDLAREPLLVLNRKVYGGDREASDSSAADDFLEALERLCAGVVRVTCDSKRRWRADNLKDALLARLSRTTSGADAYAFVVSLLGLDAEDATDFVVMPRQSRNFRKRDAPNLELRRSPHGTFLARVCCVNSFAIHRFCDGYDVDECDAELVEADRSDERDDDTSSTQDLPHNSSPSSNRRHPEWLPVDCVVVDELVFDQPDATVQSKRLLTISVPDGWTRQVLF